MRRLQLIWWFSTRVTAPFLAMGWPLLCAYGLWHPRVADMKALQLRSGEVAILVGTSALDRSYVILPRSLPTATVSSVSRVTASTKVAEQPGAAIILVAIWIACLYSTWHYLVGPVVRACNSRSSGL